MRLTISTAMLSLLAMPALAEPPQIVTDIPVTGSLVQQVLGDLGEVRVLINEGSDPHHFQLRPSDAKALQSADLLVWIGPELTPWLERATGNLGEGEAISLLHAPGTHLREFGAGHDDHEHAHDHGHEHAGEHEHEHAGEHEHEEHAEDHSEEAHGHDHDGTDPHAWLDPANAQLWLTVIAENLASRDPGNAETYASNAEAAIRKIDELEQQIATRLEPARDSDFVVFHDAYGYFTTHFGLRPAIAVSLGDASSPSAARLSEISAKVTESGAECAFPEYGHDPALIGSATEGSDIRVGAELDPAGRGLEAGAELYGNLLENMGEALADCLTAKG